MKELLKKAAEQLKEKDRIRVISHYDADGISAASIFVRMLQKLGKEFIVSIVPGLDKGVLTQLAKEEYSTFVFLDLGSGSIADIEELFAGKDVFVLDHHVPSSKAQEIIHVNPHLFGLDGGTELSASSLCYLFCKELTDITEMAHIALVGALGDLQEPFSPYHETILKESDVEVKKGIRLYGGSRPLLKALEFSSFFESREEAEIFVEKLGISPEKKVNELNEEDVTKLQEALSVDNKEVLWNIYSRKDDDHYKDLREFVTILNACGKMNKPSLGIAACLGGLREKAVGCLFEYRQEILKAREWFKANRKGKRIIDKEGFVIINAQDKIMGALIGTLASMLKEEKGTIIGLSHVEEKTKVSMRSKTIDAQATLKALIKKLGKGQSGGHKQAAGAFIPRESEEEFIRLASRLLEEKSVEEEITA
ncbi:DHH family phosphoesterase [Candidatus Woesearchaeota archaeon]|nr:DHH family phosphoesterase [Candidatus Woesearchaeota archaeon]